MMINFPTSATPATGQTRAGIESTFATREELSFSGLTIACARLGQFINWFEPRMTLKALNRSSVDDYSVPRMGEFPARAWLGISMQGRPR